MSKRAPQSLPKHITSLLTAIVVDDIGQPKQRRTAKQEITEFGEYFTGFCKPVPLSIYTPHTTFPGEFKPGTDLVLYDYGCVADTKHTPFGNARHLLHWAQENSNSLIVVVSEITFTNYVAPEMRELGLLSDEVHNITLLWKGRNPIPDWFKMAHGIKA